MQDSYIRRVPFGILEFIILSFLKNTKYFLFFSRTTKYCEDIQLKFVEGTGHFVQQEEPKHVNSLIWEYLDITN